MEDLKRIIEALLFASPEPLSIARIRSILQGVETGEVTQALESLKRDYEEESRSFQIVEIGGGYQLATKPDYAVFVGKLVESRSKQRLSKAAMETLAIVAYKQPVVRSAIEGIRGVNADGVLRTLMERDLIRIVGRGDGPGRPLLFGTTRDFLLQFGLNKLSDLPGMKEIEELVGAGDGGPASTEEDEEETPHQAVSAEHAEGDKDAGPPGEEPAGTDKPESGDMEDAGIEHPAASSGSGQGGEPAELSGSAGVKGVPANETNAEDDKDQ